jgi:hypothetical protein
VLAGSQTAIVEINPLSLAAPGRFSSHCRASGRIDVRRPRGANNSVTNILETGAIRARFKGTNMDFRLLVGGNMGLYSVPPLYWRLEIETRPQQPLPWMGVHDWVSAR